MLILGCSGLRDEKEELELMKRQVEFYDVLTTTKIITNIDHFFAAFNEGQQFDYIYLSAHGDEYGFSDENGQIDIKWSDFGELLHNNDCLKDESHLLLSCCKGGLNDVAYDLINFCPQISYVVGPRSSLYPQETLMGFCAYMYNVEYKGVDPVISTEKIRNFIDLRFICFDSLEVKTETAYLIRSEKYEIIAVDMDNDGKKDEIIIREKDEQGLIYTEEQAKEQAELNTKDES